MNEPEDIILRFKRKTWINTTLFYLHGVAKIVKITDAKNIDCYHWRLLINSY